MNERLGDISLQWKLAAATTMLLALGCGVLLLSSSAQQRQAGLQGIEMHARTTAALVAGSIARELQSDGKGELRVALSSLENDPDLRQAKVFATDGSLLVALRPKDATGQPFRAVADSRAMTADGLLTVTTPVLGPASTRLATLQLSYDLSNLEASLSSASQDAVFLLFIILAAGALFGALFGLAIAQPMRRTVRLLDAIAKGEPSEPIEVRGILPLGDEISHIGAAIRRCADGASALRDALTAVGRHATTLAHSSTQLTSVSKEMTSNAQETAKQAERVTSAAEEINRNIQTVAASTDTMNVSINEISKSAHEAARVATAAVGQADTTNALVSKLADSSTEIGSVIKIINSIAEQTNLLALNAAIEAARAGDAGKGFAVVANEVKELAKATAKATEEIGGRLAAIQVDTREAIEAIGDIGKIIGQINEIQYTIASAVEEQTATTSEIIRNLDEVAKGSYEIAQNIGHVANTAHGTSDGARNTEAAAMEVADVASALNDSVGQLRS